MISINVSVDLSASLEREITQLLQPVVHEAGQLAAQQLIARVSRGTRSGAPIRGKPGVRRSVYGEYPQEDTSAYVDSITSRMASNLEAQFGPLLNPPGHAFWLEFKDRRSGGRQPLLRFSNDRDAHAKILDGLGDKFNDS